MSGLTTPVDAGAGGDKAYRWTLRIYTCKALGYIRDKWVSLC